tara:strand:- start:192 stop:554 length:363 start_codon:yes stop_codon:yes gene_type:complete
MLTLIEIAIKSNASSIYYIFKIDPSLKKDTVFLNKAIKLNSEVKANLEFYDIDLSKITIAIKPGNESLSGPVTSNTSPTEVKNNKNKNLELDQCNTKEWAITQHLCRGWIHVKFFFIETF